MEQGPSPKVSIVIPVYNREDFLAGCLDSVLGQTYTNAEVIVVDDGSTDRTPEVLQRYSDRIHLIRQSNAGTYVACNHALEVATGNLVTFVGSDDRIHPEKVARQVTRFAEHPDVVVVYTHYSLRDERGNVSVPSLPDPIPSDRNLPREILRTGGGGIRWATMMVRMERMREARFFDTTHSLAMDQELGIRLAELGPFERIDEPLYEVTLHGDHLSQKLEQKEAALLYIVQKTLAREPYLRDRCLLREATGQVHLRLASAAYSQEAAPLARRHLSTTFRVWPWAWRRPSTLLLALKVLLGRRFVQSVAKRMGRGTGPKWQRNRSPRDDPRDP